MDEAIRFRPTPPLGRLCGAIGCGDGEMFLRSDALAIAPFIDRIAYLEEGDWVALTRSLPAEKGNHLHFA